MPMPGTPAAPMDASEAVSTTIACCSSERGMPKTCAMNIALMPW